MGPALKYSDAEGPVWDTYYPLVRFCELWQPLEALKDGYNSLWNVAYDRDPKTGMRSRSKIFTD
jgi:hypothetical protein